MHSCYIIQAQSLIQEIGNSYEDNQDEDPRQSYPQASLDSGGNDRGIKFLKVCCDAHSNKSDSIDGTT